MRRGNSITKFRKPFQPICSTIKSFLQKRWERSSGQEAVSSYLLFITSSLIAAITRSRWLSLQRPTLTVTFQSGYSIESMSSSSATLLGSWELEKRLAFLAYFVASTQNKPHFEHTKVKSRLIFSLFLLTDDGGHHWKRLHGHAIIFRGPKILFLTNIFTAPEGSGMASHMWLYDLFNFFREQMMAKRPLRLRWWAAAGIL